jgi:hypothetical protein
MSPASAGAISGAAQAPPPACTPEVFSPGPLGEGPRPTPVMPAVSVNRSASSTDMIDGPDGRKGHHHQIAADHIAHGQVCGHISRDPPSRAADR